MAESPAAFGQMLVAYDFLLGPVDEFAVVGPAAAPETQEVLRVIRAGFHPNKVVAVKDSAGSDASNLVPLLAGKTSAGAVTTYICCNFTCAAPLLGVEELKRKLGEQRA